MSYSDVNRLVELQQALGEMRARNNVKDSLRGPATVAALKANDSLAKHAPVGKVEPDYYIEQFGRKNKVSHGRPSIRLFGTTLAKAWNSPRIEDDGDGVLFSITSSAPHMAFIMDGTKGHDIPKRTPGPMSFYSFANGRPFTSFWFKSFVAEHPGTEKSNFVEEALNSGLESDIGDQLLNGLRISFRPLDKYFAT